MIDVCMQQQEKESKECFGVSAWFHFHSILPSSVNGLALCECVFGGGVIGVGIAGLP